LESLGETLNKSYYVDSLIKKLATSKMFLIKGHLLMLRVLKGLGKLAYNNFPSNHEGLELEL